MGIWEGKSLKSKPILAVSTIFIFPNQIMSIIQAFHCFSAFCQIKIFVVMHGFQIIINNILLYFMDIITSAASHKKKAELTRPQFINPSMLHI